MGFSGQEHWSGLPCLSPGNLPDPLTEPSSLKSRALAGRFFTTSTSATWEVTHVSEFKMSGGWEGQGGTLDRQFHYLSSSRSYWSSFSSVAVGSWAR